MTFRLTVEPDDGVRFTITDNGSGYPAAILACDSQAMTDG